MNEAPQVAMLCRQNSTNFQDGDVFSNLGIDPKMDLSGVIFHQKVV